MVRFYSENEGVGLESDPLRIVRLCRLEEVAQIQWSDLHVLGEYEFSELDASDEWERFSAFRIGVSSFFDETVYVLEAPSCPPGSIMTLGIDIGGPGGSGWAALEPSRVLASAFDEWLRHMEQMGWEEYGLADDIAELPARQQAEAREYYQALNPMAVWFRA